MSCVIGLETDDFFWLLELFQVQVIRQCGQPIITFSERSRLFDRLFLRKLRLLQWLCFTCLCILGIEKPKNSCCCCSELIIDEIMELGFDFTNELKLLCRLISIRALLPSLVSVSSYKDVVVVVVLREKQHRCCSHCFFSAVVFLLCFFVCIFYPRIIKTISLYHETLTDPLQLPNRTPDQLLGLQLLYRKQNDLYAWKEESMLSTLNTSFT